MATHSDAAMVAIGRLEVAVEDAGRIVEIVPDFVVPAGLIVLDCRR